MKLLSYRIAWAVGIGVGACAIGAGVGACGSSSSSSGGPSNNSTNGTLGNCTHPESLTIAYNPMYSASIPGSTAHTFQVPAVVSGVSGSNVVWSASDMTAVGLQPDSATGGIMITILKPGTVKIFANIGTDLCGSAPLTVTSATEDEWTAGNSRYNNMQPLINPFANRMMGMGGEGGAPMGPPPGGFMIPGPNTPSILEPADGGPGPACTNCHGPTATMNVFRGIDHTPEQTAGFSDQELTDIIVNGIIPDGGYYDSTIIPYQYWQFFHKWRDMTPTEQTGIITYLRSLTPVPQSGKTDFGGAFGRDGGMMMMGPPPMGDDSGSAGDGSTPQPDATMTTVVDAGADATPE
jgi:hypothetical protein